MASTKDFLIEDGVLTKYVGSSENVVIPDGIHSIGKYAFARCKHLISVTIPDGVTVIGDAAFSWCENLTAAVIPHSVTSIGKDAFWHCEKLTSCAIPDHITDIDPCMFYHCMGLVDADGFLVINGVLLDYFGSAAKVVIPKGTRVIAQNAFLLNRSLQTVIIPDGVTDIGPYAFLMCQNLKSVKAPESLTSIGAAAFQDCRSLSDFTIPDAVTHIGTAAFCRCLALPSVTIPSTLTSIEPTTFIQCGKLTSVTIPENVTAVGEHAFASCGNLKDVIFEGTTETGICRPSAFANCLHLEMAVIPQLSIEEANLTLQIAASVGYLSCHHRYRDTAKVEAYRTLVHKHWNRILQILFSRELSQAMSELAHIGMLYNRNFDSDLLQPAFAAGVHSCIAVLLDWKHKHDTGEDSLKALPDL